MHQSLTDTTNATQESADPARMPDEQTTGVADDADETAESDATGESRPQRLVPVSEAKRYRRRAQVAEERIRELEADLQQRHNELNAQQRQLDAMTRQQTIEQVMTDLGAVDTEVVGALLEQQLEGAEPDTVETAARELRRRKPFLFRPEPALHGASVQGPDPRQDGRPRRETLEHAAADALATGRRPDVLRYLRLRRSQR